MMGQQAIKFQVERRRIGKVRHADRAPPDLVFVGGSDTAPRCADLRAGGRLLAGRIDVLVPGQDQHGVVSQNQIIRPKMHTGFCDALDLVQQVPRIDHHAIADDGQLAAAHDA